MDEFAIDGFKLHAADQMADDFIKILTKEIKSNNPSFYIIASTLQGDNHLENLINNEYIDAVENSELYRAMNESLIEPDQPISALYDTWKETGNKSHSCLLIIKILLVFQTILLKMREMPLLLGRSPSLIYILCPERR